MAKINFDPEKHIYTVDGRIIPSVTQILAEVGLTDFSRVNEDVLRRSADFGDAAHKATELYDLGTLDYFSLDESLCGIVNAWEKFRKDIGFVPLIIEKPLYSAKYGFAGTPDRIGTIGKDGAVVDIKTGVLLPATEIQLEGYEILALETEWINEKKLWKIAVQLLQDGTYKTKEYKDKTTRTAFLSCLNIYNYKLRR